MVGHREMGMIKQVLQLASAMLPLSARKTFLLNELPEFKMSAHDPYYPTLPAIFPPLCQISRDADTEPYYPESC